MKVSVIIPVYNVSAYIERCIRSVMNQTYTDFECILVDDATPDDSIEKCERLIADYQGNIRFKIIHHEKNRGLSAARNTGTDAATGDYILYIDSDDAITNDCIEKLTVPIIRDNTIEMVVGNEECYSDGYPLIENRSEKHECEDLEGNEAVRDFYYGRKAIGVYAWNRLIRKDFLVQHGITFKEELIWEDHLWTFYVMKHLRHLYVIKDVTYHYYRRPDSITTGTDIKTQQHHRGVIYHEMSNNFTSGDSRREAILYVRRFCHDYVDCGHHELYKEAARNFKKELSLQHDTALYLRLVAVDILSKTWMGRKAYHGMQRVWRGVKDIVKGIVERL